MEVVPTSVSVVVLLAMFACVAAEAFVWTTQGVLAALALLLLVPPVLFVALLGLSLVRRA